jgi:hypothetical protein
VRQLSGPDVSGLPEELLAKWGTQAGREFHYQQAQNTVRAMVEGVEDGTERGGVLAAFNELPASVPHHVIEHLAVPPTPGRDADKNEMAKFIAHEEGAELAREWGNAAPRNVRMANSRIKTIIDAMPVNDRLVAREWLASLSPAQAKAMFRALVG